ncbi:MAG: Redoxin domain protein [Pedosphaera sp.]|nr:Redoxin domain protein [Pedosphaera sp.]
MNLLNLDMKFPGNPFFLLYLLWFFTQCANCPAKEKSDAPKIGDVPPPLILRSLLQGPPTNGVTWGKLHGRVVVLEFWGVRCAPCVEAIPHLNELVAQFGKKPVVFISISSENEEYVKGFLHKTPISGWIASDALLTPTSKGFCITGIPTTVIVDAAGRIAAITHPSQLKVEHLNEVLAGKPCSLPQKKNSTAEEPSIEPKREPIPKNITVSIKGPFPVPKGAFDICYWDKAHCIFKAEKAYLRDALAAFYDINPKMISEEGKLSEKLYDISVVGPPDRRLETVFEFEEALRTTLGIVTQTNTSQHEVYVVKAAPLSAPGLSATKINGGGGQEPGGFKLGGAEMSVVCSCLTLALNKQVIDETHMTNLLSVQINWELSEAEKLGFRLDKRIQKFIDDNPGAILNGPLPKELNTAITPEDLEFLKAELTKPENEQFQPDPAKVIKAAREQLGLELQPAIRLLPGLEVRKAKSRIE